MSSTPLLNSHHVKMKYNLNLNSPTQNSSSLRQGPSSSCGTERGVYPAPTPDLKDAFGFNFKLRQPATLKRPKVRVWALAVTPHQTYPAAINRHALHSYKKPSNYRGNKVEHTGTKSEYANTPLHTICEVRSTEYAPTPPFLIPLHPVLWLAIWA